MSERTRQIGTEMPDVPNPDFVGALAEVWSGVSYAAYHLAYVRVYLQTAALHTSPKVIDKVDPKLRELMQPDLLICRAHIAAFFWQTDHIFEVLRAAIARGQKEHAELQYFWLWEKRLGLFEETPIRKEINAYRNHGHKFPAIIGCLWDEDHNLVRHYLPTIEGYDAKEEKNLIDELHRYFEFAVNVWLDFAPGDYKQTVPRDFAFRVTVPLTYIGELPSELNNVPQLSVVIEAFNRPDEGEKRAE
jgi:hypothetical protein